MKLATAPEMLNLLRQGFWIYDDFTDDQSDITWVDTIPDLGSAAVGDAVGGVMVLTASDGTVADNDEVYLESPNEVFKFAASKPLLFETYAQYAEANTDDANVFLGLVDAVAADLMVDNGAGPKTTASGVGFFKVDGGTNWQIFASLSTTQTKVELTAANSLDGVAKTAGGASYQRFRIEVLPKTSAHQDILYFIDDILVYKVTDHVFTSATEMQIGLGIKNGGANNEVLSIDYVFGWQKR